MATVPSVTASLAASLAEDQQAIFYAQLGQIEKDEVAGVLLALFLGVFGAHHFYLRRTGLGVAYALFFWTGIPAILGLIECFLMPSRVQRYNLEQASALAGSLRGASAATPATYPAQPLVVRHCASCGAIVADGVRFCAKCGAPMV